MGMLRGVKKVLTKQGLIPPKQYDLKC